MRSRWRAIPTGKTIGDSDLSIWLARLRSKGERVEIASNLSEGYANLSCCTLGMRAPLFYEEPATVAASINAVRGRQRA